MAKNKTDARWDISVQNSVMKQLFLIIALLFVTLAVNAENWTVKVTVKKNIEFLDSNTGESVSKASGGTETLTFNVVADSKYNAERQAVNQCSNVCENGIPTLVAKNVKVGTKTCDKYETRIVESANATKL